jgi:hypothetical protein
MTKLHNSEQLRTIARDPDHLTRSLGRATHVAQKSCPRLKLTSCDEVGSELNPSAFIHRENFHGRAADGGETDDERASKSKMVEPFMLSRVK